MRSLTVTLPDDLVAAIEARVAAGDYASESDVVQNGLEGLLADDPAVEDWLRDEVVARCLMRAAGPSASIPAEEVLARVQARYTAKHR